MFVIVVQSLSLFATVCDPMDWSTPGFPILHYLLEFAQTHVYWVSDAIQPSHPLSPPSPPALNLSRCQGLFQWVDSSKQKKKPEGTRWSPGIGAGHCPLLGGWEPAKDSAPEPGGLQSSWDTRQEQQATTGHFSFAPPPTVLCEHHWDALLVRAHLSLG